MKATAKACWFDSQRTVIILAIASLALPTTAALFELVSTRSPAFAPPSGGSVDSALPIISADGRQVLFASAANNLVPASTNPAPNLLPFQLNCFVRDRTNGTTTQVSVNLAGTGGGNADSLPAGISTNGRYVLFESTASNLVAGDANNSGDVFLRDLAGGTTLLVSTTTGGSSGNGVSRNSVFTPDGRSVAFVSSATNLVAGDTNRMPDVFVRDLLTGITTMVSAGAKSTNASTFAGSSEAPDITPDGRYVAFFSSATNLVPGVKSTGEIYVRDLIAGTTAWASTNARTITKAILGTSNIFCYNASISADGQFVAFEASTNTAYPSSSPRGVILRHSLQTGFTDIVHTNANVPMLPYQDIHNLDLTPDGRFIAFVANLGGSSSGTSAIYLWDAQTGTNTLVSADVGNALPTSGVCDAPMVDPTGRYVAFLSSATNLTSDALAGAFHIYVRDVQTTTTRLADADTNGIGQGVGSTSIPSLSADGHFVAFESADGNLVVNDRNPVFDVFVRDLVTDTTELVSARDPSLPSQTPGGLSLLSSFSLSSNAQYVAFTSESEDLVSSDTNGYRDVFVRDLLTGTTILVSVDTNGTASGTGVSTDPAISSDGRYVAFVSTANNLAATDASTGHDTQDVFVRDLQSGTTALASISASGSGSGNSDSYSPAISPDGRFVLFRSKANNLAAGSFSGSENLFLRDLESATNCALSKSGLTAAAMTWNGRYVAVVDSAGSNSGTVYTWDTQAAARVTTNSTGTGITLIAISPDGGKIAAFGGSGLRVIDRLPNTNVLVAAGSPAFRPGLQFSADGRFLTYALTLTNQVFLYDYQLNSNVVVSRSFNSSTGASGLSDSPAISADGRFVAYRTSATNSVPGDLNGVPDVVVSDRLSGATVLVSVSQSGGTVANACSLAPVFCADGKTLVFASWAADLSGSDFNNASDLFALRLVAPPITDADGDGMDDQWELDHFITLARDGSGDFDGDGVSDLTEFQAGTNPNNPASALRAAIVSGVPGALQQILWPAVPGKSYRVQFKDNLNDATWHDLNGNVTLVGNTGYAYDLQPAVAQRFYRILLNP